MNKTSLPLILFALVVLAAIIAPVSLIACEEHGEEDAKPRYELDGYITRHIDREAGVVCWLYHVDTENGSGAGISCLPLADTALQVMESVP